MVNNKEVMLMHLAESKYTWLHGAGGQGRYVLPAWSPGESGGLWRGCVRASGLGYLNASCGPACSSRAPIFHDFASPRAVAQATKLNRHRVETTWAGHIKYPSGADAPLLHRLRFGACDFS